MFFINHTDIGEGSAAIIEIEGPLNSDSSPDFDDYISKLVNNNVVNLLLDMKNLNFISSEGIGAALMIQKSISEKNGLAVFFNLNYEISSLFKLLGFDQVFTIAADRAEALNILDRRMELFPSEPKLDNSDSLEIEDEFLYTEEPRTSDTEAETEETGFEVIQDNSDIFEPFIIECIKCNSLVRIKESGEQLCPYCSAEFTVDDAKKAVFKVKDIH